MTANTLASLLVLCVLVLCTLVTAQHIALENKVCTAVVDQKADRLQKRRTRMIRICSDLEKKYTRRCFRLCDSIHHSYIAKHHRILSLSTLVQQGVDMGFGEELLAYRRSSLQKAIKQAVEVLKHGTKAHCDFALVKIEED
jgi:hypothetical protein